MLIPDSVFVMWNRSNLLGGKCSHSPLVSRHHKSIQSQATSTELKPRKPLSWGWWTVPRCLTLMSSLQLDNLFVLPLLLLQARRFSGKRYGNTACQFWTSFPLPWRCWERDNRTLESSADLELKYWRNQSQPTKESLGDANQESGM